MNNLEGKSLVVFRTEVRVTLGLIDNNDTDVAIQIATKNIKTREQADKFMQVMDQELDFFVRQESESGFQKYNRLEKLAHIGRLWNRDFTPKPIDIPKDLTAIESPLAQFSRVLISKLNGAVINMRAARDESAINREKAKTINKELILETLGMSYLMFSVLESITIDVPLKEKAKYLCDLFKDGSLGYLCYTRLEEHLNKVNERIETLKENSPKIDTTDLLLASNNAKDDINDLSENLRLMIIELEKRLDTDYKKTMCRWEKFKAKDENGNITPLFSQKEINALEQIGGWDNVIKLHDQGIVDKAISSAAKQHKKMNGLIPKPKGM